jgi:hypothetical protein
LNADVSSMIRADRRPRQAPITLGSDRIKEKKEKKESERESGKSKEVREKGAN